ncbi:25.3 kDa vesicle transport protein [Asparagus officinalis]|uniref:25.3 kDa vesicle transport protein n=1 Tax=Asparagus officinalis TaxID=4686 RepID=UPI00098E2044|nr:25.3 kDa vesicle transport protein [Asparagus officinalis]
MVKLTLIARLDDGLPLAQSPVYLNEENDVSSYYRQQGELILKEISRGAISSPKMSILIDHHCFHYIIGNRVCCITLCESWYPRKLAFFYLQDLLQEFEKVDTKLMESFSMPYTCRRFDYAIENIRRKYLDTRTQANLAKLNSNRKQDLDFVTEEFSKVVSRGQASGMEQTTETNLQPESTLWNSNPLEVIALKWTPITVFMLATMLLLWTGVSLSEYPMPM